MDVEEVEEEDGVGDHPGHLDIEEADLLLHHGLLQGAAQDEEVGPGKEDADQERIFLIRGDLVLVQVAPDAGYPEEARSQQEDGEVDQEGDAQEVEGVKVEDDDGQGDRADVEDPAGEEEGEEGAEGLDKVHLVLQGPLELLAAGGGLLLLLLVVEGEQLGADLDHHQEAHLGDKNENSQQYTYFS